MAIVTRSDFTGAQLWPPEARDLALKVVIGGAPFANSLTLDPTTRGSVAYPSVDPSGQTWVAEGAALPEINLNDSAYVVSVAKIGGVVPVTNEAIRDTSYDLDGQIGRVLVEAFSRDLDTGLLSGTGVSPQPQGVFGVATEIVEATTLVTATAEAVGEIGDAGGNPDTLAINYGGFATEAYRRTADGALVHPNGLEASLGLRIVRVPGLTQPLVYDSTKLYLVQREDFSVEQSEHFYWNTDSVALRIKARFALAVPNPAKSVRKLAATLA